MQSLAGFPARFGPLLITLLIAGCGGGEGFGTLPDAPVLAYVSVDALPKSAVITARLNPNSDAATYWVEYGVTGELGSTTPANSAGNGAQEITVSETLADLSPNTTYYYRLVAHSSLHEVAAATRTFATPAVPLPLVTTATPSAMTINGCTLNGTVTPGGYEASAWFEWGTDTRYGSETPRQSVGNSLQATPFSQPLETLKGNTTYHYRAVAGNESGSVAGEDITCTTASGVVIGGGGSNADTDGDGLSDVDEINVYGTNPVKADTDGDGLSDGQEIKTYHTDPKAPDTDGDGLTDGEEVNVYITDPLNADGDGDGLSDGAEVKIHQTDPNKADSDGDGLNDGNEVRIGMNPLIFDGGIHLPDFVVTSVTAARGVMAGEQLAVTATVKNNGLMDTKAAFDVGIYLSKDLLLDAGDLSLSLRRLSGLLSGQSNVVTASATIPFGAAQGVYYLIAVVDTGNEVPEGDELNNATPMAGSLTVGAATETGGDAGDGFFTVAGTFNISTASSHALGNTLDGNGAYADGYATRLTGDAAVGATTLSVANSAGFVTGDEAMIIQITHAGNAGVYEVVKGVTVVNATTLSLPVGLMHNYYAAGAADAVQVVRVPQYAGLIVPSGAILTVSAWNPATATGGVLALRATTVTVSGTVAVDGLGFAGGVSRAATGGFATQGYQGASYAGAPAAADTANNFGGGGGGETAGGAGAGYVAAGGGAQGVFSSTPAYGGAAYGDPSLSRLYLGSGGGGGGGYNDNSNNNSFVSGAGGTGGGIVFIGAGAFTVDAGGMVSSNGRDGEIGAQTTLTYPTSTSSGGGGGGAGGSILVQAATHSVFGSMLVSGGNGGIGSGQGNTVGGFGAAGRIAQVTVMPVPDLIVSAVNAPTSIVRGSPVSVDVTVQNVARVPAGGFNVGIYLSSDPVITTADYLVGSYAVAGLAGYGSQTTSAAVTIPTKTLGGEAYTYRIPIVINGSKISGTAPLTDFPVLVDITSRELASFYYGGKSLDPYVAGLDILFYAADKVTRLDFDRVKYDPGSGRMIAWVRMPVLTPGVNTTIYVYYGNPSVGIAVPWNNAAAWNSAYKGVWHLEGGPVNPDSTSNGNTASDLNGYGSTLDGKVGSGYYNNGSGSVKTLDTVSSVLNPGASDWTVEGWVRYDAPLALKQVLFSTANLSTGRNLLYLNGGDYAIKSSHSGTEYSSGYNANLLLTWYHVALAKTGSGSNATLTWYVNGSPVYSQSGVTVNSDTSPWRLGNGFDLGENFKGMLDELRASNVARSAGWIATEYNNMNDPASFVTLQAPQTVPAHEPLAYYLGAVVDMNGSVAEADENNNFAVTATLSGAPQASVVSALFAPGAAGSAGGTGGGGAALDVLGLLIVWRLTGKWRRRTAGANDRPR